MNKTSHKKNRPFDFKLIDLVEPHPVLYQRQMGLSTYESMKAKNLMWKKIAEQMNASIEFCIMRWGNLRGQFQKELRHCRELCPKRGLIRGSTWPYLQRLHFLESTVQFNRPKRIRISKRQKKALEEIERSFESDHNSVDMSHKQENFDNSNDTEIVEETVEDGEFSLIEEVAEEYDAVGSEEMTHFHDVNVEVDQMPTTIEEKMRVYLESLSSVNRRRAERRILAYLCKCQLRALHDQSIADLVI